MTDSSVWTGTQARSDTADEAPGPAAASAGPFVLPEPDGWSDALTATDGPRFWDRIVASEGARRRRYHRPVTVAMVEFDGFATDGSWLGHDLALKLFVLVARVLAKEVRTSDYIARIGPARFGILLIEADEINAINFIDRVRTSCQQALGTGSGFVVRTGWASPTEAETLDAAVHRAGLRLSDPAFQGAP